MKETNGEIPKISFIENNILKIDIDEKFIGERGRINCSLRVER